MMKNFLLLLLLTTLVSCEKEPAIHEEPDPVVPELTASFSRSFLYINDNSLASVSYPLSIIKAKAMITDNKSLLIDLDTTYPDGNDNATIVIPLGKIKSGYTGDYPIQISSTAETEVSYQYRLSEASSNKVLPGTSSGNLKIVSYNSEFKTIKGEFSFTVNVANDPRSSAVSNFRQTTISVNGSFENLVIK